MREPPLRGGIRTFGRFSLDAARGCLLMDGTEVPLRPKTFALLCHLAANPGRLVSKDELIAAVWRGAQVSDDVLVQSVGELRRALDGQGADLIRTVPRRGYRFEAEVLEASASAPANAAASAVTGIPAPVQEATLRPQIVPGRLYVASLMLLATVLAIGVVKFFGVQRQGDASGQSVRTTHAEPVIAVLPFADPGADLNNTGLDERLIATLSRFSSLVVKSGRATQPYRGAGEHPAKVAHDLDVQYQIEGSVGWNRGQAIASARLVDSKGDVLWTGDFAEERVGRFAAEVAFEVSQSEQRIAAAKPPDELDAYDHVQRARQRMRTWDLLQELRTGLADAREHAILARGLDPAYAPAWTMLAEVHLAKVIGGYTEFIREALEKAEEAADHAVGLDPSDVRAHVVRAHLYLLTGRDSWAQEEVDRLLEINPNDAYGLAARGHILVYLGQTDAAISTLESVRRLSMRLELLHGWDGFSLSMAYYLKGRYAEAKAAIKIPDLPLPDGALPAPEFSGAPLVLLAACLAQLGDGEKAREVAQQARRVDPASIAKIRDYTGKLRNPGDRRRVEEGLVKAGLLPASQAPPPWTPGISP